MGWRRSCVAVLALLIVGAPACSPPDDPGAAPAVRLGGSKRTDAPYLEVTGLGRDAVRALAKARFTPTQWAELLQVSTGPDEPPVAGAYSVAGGAVRFTPAYPFDRGLPYRVRLDRARLPGSPAAPLAPLVFTFERPAPATPPSTEVAAVYPTAAVVPENLRRLYVQFSAPMSLRYGARNLQLLDGRGRGPPQPLPPLESAFWNPARTRFTLVFDRTRGKDPRMGRPLQTGRSYTLVIGPDWRDANGLPLRQPYRRAFQVGEAQLQPLDPKAWRITAPPAGGREPLIVSFPGPLDQDLMSSALGVQDRGAPVEGEAVVAPGEMEWRFIPLDPWRAGDYALVAQPILEDVAGAQVARAAGIDTSSDPKGAAPGTATLAFKVAR
ncbi:MAG TPA: hypothetical protein VL460_08010 [Caulobacteraceae bacterium]|jgi:hypothetical protein|nr:hypothetical protein [Caulobacteraceae bacterium]